MDKARFVHTNLLKFNPLIGTNNVKISLFLRPNIMYKNNATKIIAKIAEMEK